MALPLPIRLSLADVNAILLLVELRVNAIVEPLPKPSVDPNVRVAAAPGLSVPLTNTAPLIIPDPPRVAGALTVNALLALVEPFTRSVPAFTSVFPV